MPELADATLERNPANLERQTREVVGTFIGVLPDTQRFQINTNDGESIHGRVVPEADDAYQIVIEHTNQQVRPQIRAVRIGRGAPNHTLLPTSEAPNRVSKIPPNPNAL